MGCGDIDLRLVFQSEASSAELLDRYRRLLTEEELARGARFYFERHRTQFLLTRALVRSALSTYADVDPKDWRFEAGEYGRPHLVGPTTLEGLSFNLAHTEGLIVLACTRGGVVGVDVEHVQPRRTGLDIAERFFSPAEVAELKSAPLSEQTERFFHYWTLKESYIKAIGTGLSTPLDQFGFELANPGRIRMFIDERLADRPERWRCWLLRPAADYFVSVCVERAAEGEGQELNVRRVVPLISDETLAAERIAQSA